MRETGMKDMGRPLCSPMQIKTTDAMTRQEGCSMPKSHKKIRVTVGVNALSICEASKDKCETTARRV